MKHRYKVKFKADFSDIPTSVDADTYQVGAAGEVTFFRIIPPDENYLETYEPVRSFPPKCWAEVIEL